MHDQQVVMLAAWSLSWSARSTVVILIAVVIAAAYALCADWLGYHRYDSSQGAGTF
jgi:hypothetical protein